MISLTDARRIIAEQLSALPPAFVPLADAHGRVLAADAVADAFYPSGDRSMMDGYAIAADAGAGRFRVVAEIQAGQTPTRALGPGEAARIFTGALVPEGSGRVVMQEETRRDGDFVIIEQLPERRFIRPQGSEAKPGDVVVRAGSRLGAAELAILAQVGSVEPSVVKEPIIRHIATGSELVAPSAQPVGGQIRDTNSTLLAALLREADARIAESHRCGDDPSTLATLGAAPCDLLLLSGGASVGDFDFGPRTLRELGFTIHFDRVNLRPGKPLTFATRGRQAAFVIPGNPVSHFVCFHVAIRLTVDLLRGLPARWPIAHLPLAPGEPLRADPRESFWPARLVLESGRLAVSPMRWSTSGDTFSLADTNALVRVAGELPADGTIETLILRAP